MNSQNGKILLDATKCKENEEIAKITLNIKQGIKNADTKIISTLSIHILIIIRIIDCVNFMFNNIMRI